MSMKAIDDYVFTDDHIGRAMENCTCDRSKAEFGECLLEDARYYADPASGYAQDEPELLGLVRSAAALVTRLEKEWYPYPCPKCQPTRYDRKAGLRFTTQEGLDTHLREEHES